MSGARLILTLQVDLKIPVLIVISTGVLLGIVGLINRNEFNVLKILSSLLFTFISWIFLSTSIFIISHFMKGKGSYLRNIELIGYTYLPIAIALILESISLIFGMSFWPLYSILFGSWSLVIMVFLVREINQISTMQSVITIAVSFFVVMALFWNFIMI